MPTNNGRAMSASIPVFVYGSLMRGMPYERHMQGATFVCEGATTARYVLLLYREGYPALTDRDPERPGFGGVPGEVYLVSPAHLARLDAFEECPQLYQRRSIELVDGSRAEAYCVPANERAVWPEIERWHPEMTERRWTGDRG